MTHESGLLLLGHGSTLNGDSSAPTYQHAEEIRRRGLFAEVQVAFWKEEPNFRQAIAQTACREVYVVPNFISSGYFTEEVIPRELGLTNPVTRFRSQTVYYCQPVGLHSSMTDVLLQRARDVVEKSGKTIEEPSRTACLFICGHGTSFNDNSTKIIHEQAAIIRGLGIFADCQDVFMEQAPFVNDWRTLTACHDVIVVPFFISDGLHSFEDIPVLLGLTPNVRERGFSNPHTEGERRLWYAMAIGTEPRLADVILAQVQEFRKQHSSEFSGPPNDTAFSVSPLESLMMFLNRFPPPWRIGEVSIEPRYQLCHHLDTTSSNLQIITSAAELRDLIRFDAKGDFRPLRAAPNLRRGWRYIAPDSASLAMALDYLYPAALAIWAQWAGSGIAHTKWHQTAERQSGRFRVVRDLGRRSLDGLIDSMCRPGCLKQRIWSPAEQDIVFNPSEIPLICPEACNYLVGAAREMIKGSA